MKKLINIIIRVIANAIFAKAYAVEFRQIELSECNEKFELSKSYDEVFEETFLVLCGADEEKKQEVFRKVKETKNDQEWMAMKAAIYEYINEEYLEFVKPFEEGEQDSLYEEWDRSEI